MGETYESYFGDASTDLISFSLVAFFLFLNRPLRALDCCGGTSVTQLVKKEVAAGKGVKGGWVACHDAVTSLRGLVIYHSIQVQQPQMTANDFVHLAVELTIKALGFTESAPAKNGLRCAKDMFL